MSRGFCTSVLFIFIEHVVVNISLPFEGDNTHYAQQGKKIVMNPTSPKQNTSIIAPYKKRDVIEKTYDNWSFLLVNFWEEYPTGMRTLTVEY